VSIKGRKSYSNQRKPTFSKPDIHSLFVYLWKYARQW